MIEYPTAPVAVPGNHLPKIFRNTALIETLAAQFVADQVEGHIDMMADCPSLYTSFQDVKFALSSNSVTETTCQYLDDLLAEFRTALFDAVKSRQVTVKSVTITSDGFTDADVEVE